MKEPPDDPDEDVKIAVRETLKTAAKALRDFQRRGAPVGDTGEYAKYSAACRSAGQTLTLFLKLKLMLQPAAAENARDDKNLEAAYEAAERQMERLGDKFDD